MRLNLSDWLAIRWGTEQCMDVIAQLLSIPHESMGNCLDPSAFCLQFPDDDDSGFGELERERECRDFDPDLKPVSVLGTEADDVFVIGLMLYRLLTSQLPDLGMARFLMVKVHDEQRVPLLNVPNSVLGPLVERMTDLNPATRIRRTEALGELAKLWKGTAVISITEPETGAELERIEVPLNSGETVWKIPHRLHYGDMMLLPVSYGDLHLPFRICTKTYPFPVAVQRDVPPQRTAQILPKPAYAMDIGTGSLRLICLGGTAGREEILTVPPAAAFRTQEQLIIGSEALKLGNGGAAGVLDITAAQTNADRPVFLTAADGTSVQITPRAAAEALMSYLFGCAVQMGMYAQETIAVAFPGGWDAALRTFWLRAAQKAGFRTAAVSCPAAVLLCHSLREPVTDNIMIVDAGAGSADVCILSCRNGCTPEKLAELAGSPLQCFSAPGGMEMTGLIVRDMLRTLSLQHGISLFRREDSGLNAVQFELNRTILRETAEKIKCTLSFAAQTEITPELYDGSAAPLKISFRYTRMQLISLLESAARGLRQAMHQACANCGLSREQIASVLVTGSSSLSPVIRQTVAAFYQNTTIRILFCDRSFAAVRGAAFYTAFCGTGTVQASDVLSCDIGIITADNVQQLPEFQVLLPTGTDISGGASCTFAVTVTESDLDADSRCLLRIYSRQHGMEHVRNTLDPEGNCIHILGKLLFTLPGQFRIGEDRLEVRMTFLPDERITAEARVLCDAKPGWFGIRKKSPRSEEAAVLTAAFVPLT